MPLDILLPESMLSEALISAERIAAWRERVLRRKDSTAIQQLRTDPLVAARSLRESQDIDSWVLRRGLLTRDRLAAMRFEIDDLELLAGRLCLERSVSTDEDAAAHAFLESFPLALPGQSGHCELDFDPLMHVGIDGLADDLQRRMAQATGDVAATYQSFLWALEGLSTMIAHAADAIRQAMPLANPARQVELESIAVSCGRIVHAPPASFQDAIQLLWFVILAVMHGDQASLVVPGHLDRTLGPFYEADVARGTLDREGALLLIESLYLLVNEYVADGLAMSVLVGGRDAEGNDLTNDLSFLCLEALRRTGLIYPTVGVCWHSGTPEALTDLAVELMGHGYATPAFFGDQTIQQGLRGLGVPDGESHRYMNSTCVEITPSGASNVWVASPYYNTCGLLLDEIAAQAMDPAPTFELFLARYQDRLAGAVELGVVEQNAARLQRQAFCRRPLQSVFTRDCIARGRDIEDGGARYNWIECSFIGLANLADSLHVIREHIYRQQQMRLSELKAVLDADFDGCESLRQHLLHTYSKYGQGSAEVDGLMAQMVDFVAATCARLTVEPDRSPYVPGAFAWVMHERLGRETGATPDGRQAGFPFADGCGPAQGRESQGPTAAVLSVTSWPHSRMIGGLAYNMKFSSSLFRSTDGFQGLKALILTFLRLGGFEVQVNVMDNETLKKARANPEPYRDLVVRIGGYCDYFTRLSLEMQDELILRTEFADLAG